MLISSRRDYEIIVTPLCGGRGVHAWVHVCVPSTDLQHNITLTYIDRLRQNYMWYGSLVWSLHRSVISLTHVKGHGQNVSNSTHCGIAGSMIFPRAGCSTYLGQGKFSKIDNSCPILLKFCTQICGLQVNDSVQCQNNLKETMNVTPISIATIYNGNSHKKSFVFILIYIF